MRVGLAAIGEQLQDDRGRRQRDEESGEERRAPVDADRHQHAHRHHAGEADLQAAAAENQREDLGEPFEAELQADREQQQDDADFRDRVDELAVGDDAEPVAGR